MDHSDINTFEEEPDWHTLQHPLDQVVVQHDGTSAPLLLLGRGTVAR